MTNDLAAATEFYRECLVKAFVQTAKFSSATGRTAAQVVERPEFAAVLRETKQGSLDAARRIGEMASVHVGGAPNAPGAWWRDLCNYERGWFIPEATTDAGPPTNRPRRGVSALSMQFAWNLPKLLARLKSGETVTDDLRRNTTLLFARGTDGTVRAVEIGSAVERVFRFTNGMRTTDQIAEAAGVSVEETNKILTSLAGIGAVALSVY